MKVSFCSFNILAPMWGPEADLSYRDYYAGMEGLLPLEERLPKLLARVRQVPEGQEPPAELQRALLLTINGIAAGLRNSG